MSVHVVVQGESDEALLDRVLADLKPLYRLHLARGKNHARPWARRLHREKHEPVVLIVDADMDNPRQAQAERRELDAYLGWSSGGVPFHVTVLVPEAEVLLFKVPGLVERLSDRQVSNDLLQVAQSAPKKTIAVLFGADNGVQKRLLGRLTDGDVAAIRLLPEIAEARSFVEANAS